MHKQDINSESAFLESIKNGDKNAFEKLFRNYYSYLCSYATTYLHNVEASQDIVQEFFFKLWQKKEGLPDNINIQAYLFKSIQNSCLNYIKHQKIEERHKELSANNHKNSFSEENITETNELHTKIRLAIDKLPPERRKIFIMHRLEELKYKEIADKLNISIKTVENQIGKALVFLREELKDFLPAIVISFINEIMKIFLSK